MFPFRDNILPRRSQCLQTFKARKKNSRSSNHKLIHVFSTKTRKFQNICHQYNQQKQSERLDTESEVPLIEEIDGVQFYRTSLSVCESVTSNFIQRPKLRRSFKSNDKPTTLVNSLDGEKQKKALPRRLLESVKYISPQLFSGEEMEERKRRMMDRLENDKENLLSRVEEEEIHERAEYYAMSIKPDLKYINLPEDNHSHREDPAYVASMCGQQLEYPLPKKRKNRNSLTDSCYLSYHMPDDPYDNSQSLPCGTKLYRPPAKLVELVADAVMGSPDGLLQVPQIYTALMNRYPYFRYMDKTAVTSWRSSVRHALFQKWFKKVKFTTQEISSKGCFWCVNSQIDSAEINGVRKHEDEDVDSFDLDPNTHDTVIALLKEEDNEYSLLDSPSQETIQMGNCSVKVPVYHFKPGEDNSLNPDPVLTAYTTTNSRNSTAIVPVSSQRNAILPVSVLNTRCLSPYSDSSGSSSSLISPLMHSVRPDILGVDPCNNSSISWAPNLPFDQFLDSQSMCIQNSSSQESDVLPSSSYGFFDCDSIVPSVSPDLSSGRSSPEIYDWWSQCTSTKDELFTVTDSSSFNYSTMKIKSEDSREIVDIIPDNVQWGLGEINEVPAAIFDKDDILSLPEQLV